MAFNVKHPNLKDPNGNASNKVYIPSGEKTVSALIDTGLSIIGAIIVTTDGTNDAECVVYDGIDETGIVVARCPVDGADKLGGMVIPFRVETGIYATITGTGAKYHIYYL